MSGGGDKTGVFLHNQVDKSTKVGWADAGGSKWNVRTDGMLEPLHHLTEGVVRVIGWENNQPKLVNLGASSALTFDVPSGPPPPPPPQTVTSEETVKADGNSDAVQEEESLAKEAGEQLILGIVGGIGGVAIGGWLCYKKRTG